MTLAKTTNWVGEAPRRAVGLVMVSQGAVCVDWRLQVMCHSILERHAP